MWGHLGSQYGYTAAMLYIPDWDVSIAQLMNRGSDGQSDQIMVDVFVSVLGVLQNGLQELSNSLGQGT